MKEILAIYSKPYEVFYLPAEYPGYRGEIKYAIATDMSDEELSEKYEQEISKYRPYIRLTIEMGAVMVGHNNNDAAEHMRECRDMEVSFEEVEDTCEGEYNLWDQFLAELSDSELKHALIYLRKIQARRIYKYLWGNMTLGEIADEEGCSIPAVYYSINTAFRRLYELVYEKEEVL